MTFQEIRIIATGPCIANQLRDVNTICRSVSLSVALPATLSASESLLASTECIKTVVFAARREGVVVAPVCITNNVIVCYVSVN